VKGSRVVTVVLSRERSASQRSAGVEFAEVAKATDETVNGGVVGPGVTGPGLNHIGREQPQGADRDQGRADPAGGPPLAVYEVNSIVGKNEVGQRHIEVFLRQPGIVLSGQEWVGRVDVGV